MGSLIVSSGLKQRQSLPLDAKVAMTISRIKQWYEHFDGDVYGSFSGGKDSRVMMDLIWSIYPDVPALFVNTGLEYPEIVQFVMAKKKQGYPVDIYRPLRTFRDVVLNDGFPLISKKTANMIRRVQNPTPNNGATRNLYLTGFRRDGVYKQGSKIPERWMKLIDAPFKTTEVCCDVLKKEPFRRYQRDTGRYPFVGVMAGEGGNRSTLTECNAFTAKAPQSRPMLFWTESDVWQYITERGLDYASVYDDRVVNGQAVPGEARTGCMFCAFGAHLESVPNRFQRMAVSHPKQWSYCMNNLGMGEALDFIGVEYRPDQQIDLV